MAQNILVGTRKGLFRLKKNVSEWSISQADFLGSTVTMVLDNPRDGWLYVALNHGHFGVKLHRSADSGLSWEECAVPVYPEGATIPPDPMSANPQPKPASLSEIWALEPGGADQPERLWCGTIPGGLFRSDDRGDSWQLVESLWNRSERDHWFGGGKDDAGIHSICVHPHESNKISIGISCGGVWQTDDDGKNWHCAANGMNAEYLPPDLADDPNRQDVHRLVQSPVNPDVFWVQHHNGMYRSEDYSKSWQELENVPVSDFGFVVTTHPHDENIAWFVPGVKDECRIPVDAKLVVTRTSDGGKTFEVIEQGLPQEHCYDIVFRHSFDVDVTGNCLVMGSSTGNLWISEDTGTTWMCISNNLPPIYCIRFTNDVNQTS